MKSRDLKIWVLDNLGLLICMGLWARGTGQTVRLLVSAWLIANAVFIILQFYRRSPIFSWRTGGEIGLTIAMIEGFLAPILPSEGRGWRVLGLGIGFLLTQVCINLQEDSSPDALPGGKEPQ